MPVVDDGIPDRDGGIHGRARIADDERVGFLSRTGGHGPSGKTGDFLDRKGRGRVRLWVQHETSPVIDVLAGGCGGGRGVVGGVKLHLARLRVVHRHQPLVGHIRKSDVVNRSAGEIMGDGRRRVIGRVPGVTRAVRHRGGRAARVVVHLVARVGVGKIGVVSTGTGDVDHPGSHDDAVLDVDVLNGNDVGHRIDVANRDGKNRQGARSRVDERDGSGIDQVAVDPNIHLVVRRSVKRGSRRGTGLAPSLVKGSRDLPSNQEAGNGYK